MKKFKNRCSVTWKKSFFTKLKGNAKCNLDLIEMKQNPFSSKQNFTARFCRVVLKFTIGFQVWEVSSSYYLYYREKKKSLCSNGWGLFPPSIKLASVKLNFFYFHFASVSWGYKEIVLQDICGYFQRHESWTFHT